MGDYKGIWPGLAKSVLIGIATLSISSINNEANAQMPTNGKIALKSYNGKYVQAFNGGGSSVGVNGDQPLGWETFEVFNQNDSWELWHGNQINLRAYDGQHFLQVQCGGSWDLWDQHCGVVNASTTNQLGWETFTVEKLDNWDQGARINPGDKIALRAYNGAYCAALEGGDNALVCGAGQPQGWEAFEIVWIDENDSGGSGGSGTPPPPSNDSQFVLDFEDNFDYLDRNLWHVYDGHPGGRQNAYYAPSHVKVQNGQLVLECYWDSAYPFADRACAGMGAKGRAIKYGKWEVRVRADWGPRIDAVALLWPYHDQWTHEIDFMEDFDGHRNAVEAVPHWLPDGNNNYHVFEKHIDMTQWNTYGVIWTPGKYEFTINGQVWATFTGTPGWEIADYPMWLALQIENQGSVPAETPGNINMYVDWVRQYRYDP